MKLEELRTCLIKKSNRLIRKDPNALTCSLKGDLLHVPGLINRLATKGILVLPRHIHSTGRCNVRSRALAEFGRAQSFIVKISYRLGVDPELSQTPDTFRPMYIFICIKEVVQ